MGGAVLLIGTFMYILMSLMSWMHYGTQPVLLRYKEVVTIVVVVLFVLLVETYR